jgi:glutamate racemase
MVIKNENDLPTVCVFDSGIGGLNLLAECVKRIPYINYVYVADNYNVPYGNLSHDKILSLVEGAFKEIEKLRPSAVAIACNTVTAECIDILRKEYTFPIVGMQPAIKQAAREGGKCLILATKATIASKSFGRLIEEYASGNTVIYPCDSLASYIEENIFNLPENLPENLLPSVEADSVVLGCTHYIFAKKSIQKRYHCKIFDGIVGTADHLKTILGTSDHNLQCKGKITFKLGDFNKNKVIFNKITNEDF